MVKGPAVLREFNEKRVLTFLRLNKISSRQEITEKLELSKNTVSLIIDKLLKEDFIKEVGIDSNGVGRPRKKLSIKPDIYHSIGLHIRDHSCEFIITNYFGTIVDSQSREMDTRDPKKAIDQIVELWSELDDQYPNILGIGIAVPGLVDPDQGFIHYSTHLGWENISIVEQLSERIPVPIHALNRVKAAALSPVQIIPEGAESTFYIRIDEGVGGAFLTNHDILNGFSYTAGEVGHLVVKENGPLCTCGQMGCLEKLVNLPAILESLKKEGIEPPPVEKNSALFSNWLRKTNDKVLDRVMTKTGQYVGKALATIVNILNPQYIVIDSPYNGSEKFKAVTHQTIMDRALRISVKHATVVFVSTSLSSAWGMALSVIRKYELVTIGE